VQQFDGLRISDSYTDEVLPAADPQIEQAPAPVVEQNEGVEDEEAVGSVEAVTEEDSTSTGVVSPAADPQIQQASVPVIVQSVAVEEEEEAGSVQSVTEEDTTMVSGYKVDCTESKLIQIFC
jgi:hypothetical protein